MLFEDEDLKRWKIGEFGPGRLYPCAWSTCHPPRAWKKIQCAKRMAMLPEHDVGAPSMQKLREPTCFPTFLVGKTRFFSPNPVRNSHYN